MNSIMSPSNDGPSDERQPKWHERRARGPHEHQFVDSKSDGERASWAVTAGLIIAFWIVWYVAYTAYDFAIAPTKAPEYLLPRVLIAFAGMVLSIGIAAVIVWRLDGRLARRALVAGLLAVVATAMHNVLTLQIWRYFEPVEMGTAQSLSSFVTGFIIRFWFFASITAMILALTYVSDIQEREKRIAGLQALAHSAQLRALRTQLNPHFLFNALNSIAALLSRERNAEAEKMTESLADFLRTTLELDPQKLITLSEEIQLQELYLAVEAVRFPDRLHVVIEVPTALQDALVPSLITQPLVENSIKYAVAQSSDLVRLTIEASSANEQLILVVQDDGGNAKVRVSQGIHFGLANVAERLRANYGNEASLDCGPTANGGFRNVVRLPLERQ